MVNLPRLCKAMKLACIFVVLAILARNCASLEYKGVTGNFAESSSRCDDDGADLVYLDALMAPNISTDLLDALAQDLAQEAKESGCTGKFFIGLNRKICKDEYWWQGGSKTNDDAPSNQNLLGPSPWLVKILLGADPAPMEDCIVFSPEDARFYSSKCNKQFDICCGDHTETTPELLPPEADEGYIQTWSSQVDDTWLRYLDSSNTARNFAMLTKCMDWQKAAAMCESINGKLATIRTEAEHTAVVRMAKYAQALTDPYFKVTRTRGAWVGAAKVGDSMYYLDDPVPNDFVRECRKRRVNRKCVYFSYTCKVYGLLDEIKCSRCLHVLCECDESCELN